MGEEPQPTQAAGLSRSSKALIAAAVIGAVAVAVMWIWGFWLYVTHDHPGGFIGDERFVADANGICAAAAKQRPEPAGKDASMAERADTVEESAMVFEDMVERLRELPVAAEDREEVEDWLDRWDELNSVGRRYAEAIRAESDDFEGIGNEGDAPATYVNGFAIDNGMDDCVF